jgi:hypothetical protein
VSRFVAAAVTVLVLLVAVACASNAKDPATTPIACMPGDASVPQGTTLVSEDSAGACPSAPIALTGTLLPGAPCSMDAQCAPACCACGSKVTSALVASCVSGRCASTNQVCCGYSAAPSCT